MLYNEHNLAVAKIASTSPIKPAIASVMFTKDKTVATDSFRLLEVTVPQDAKAEDFPKVDGTSAMRGAKPFLVLASQVKEIKVPKKQAVGILNHVAVSHVSEHRIEMYTTDGEVADKKNMRRVEDEFPEYERIFPTGEPVAEVTLNGDYLAELVSIMAKIKSGGAVTLKFYEKNRPLVLVADNGNQSARGLLMPINE